MFVSCLALKGLGKKEALKKEVGLMEKRMLKMKEPQEHQQEQRERCGKGWTEGQD